MKPKTHSESAVRRHRTHYAEKIRSVCAYVAVICLQFSFIQIGSSSDLFEEAARRRQPLRLTGVCSSDPSVERRWRINNPNNCEIAVTWEHVSTKETGTLMAPPGRSRFVTRSKNSNPNATNTVRISWKDRHGRDQSVTAGAKGKTCDRPRNNNGSCEQREWLETFDLPNGACVDNGSTPWYLDVSDARAPFSFSVSEKRLVANNVDGEVRWFSKVIDISAWENIALKAHFNSSGFLEEDQDYVEVGYILDGGTPTRLENGYQVGYFDAAMGTAKGISGQTLQLYFKAYNTSTSEWYRLLSYQAVEVPVTVDIAGDTQLRCGEPTTLEAQLVDAPADGNFGYEWTRDGTVVGTGKQLEITESGDYAVNVTYGSCQTSASVQVSVEVDEAPVPRVEMLPDVTLSCGSTQVEAPLADDDCDGEITGVLASTPDLSVPGSYTLEWEFEDSQGQTASQLQLVTVLGEGSGFIPDLAELPTLVFNCGGAIQCFPTASSDCGSVTATTDDAVVFEEQGTFTITWTYGTDANALQQDQTVIVRDEVAPVPDATDLVTITGECSASIDDVPTATDNCVGAVIGTTTDPLTYDAVGSYEVTWTYDDGNGNQSTQAQLVVVEDTEAPVPDLDNLPTVTASCGFNLTDVPTATDICDGNIPGTSADELSFIETGTYTVSWTYTDGAGNSSSQEQQIIIEDTAAPIANEASLPEIAGECTATITEIPTATDECEGLIIGETADPLTYNEAGTYTVTWAYVDGSGNSATQTQQVIVEDSNAPVADAEVLPDVIGECSVTVDVVPTATDECEGSIAGSTNDPLTYSEVGVYTITWTYADASGNSSTQQQQVIVEDNAAPVADADELAEVVGECGVTIDDVPTATDQCEGSITGTTNDPLTYTELGTYTVTWNYVDGSGNSSSQTQQVTVQDSGAPIADLAILPEVLGECSVTVTDTPLATDECEGVIAGTTSDPLTYTEVGTYTITWNYVDGSGNSSSQTQQVTVQDSSAPVADLTNLPDVVGECSVTIIEAPTASDECEGVIVGTTSDPLSYMEVGIYTITWTYTDGSGNSSSQTQQVVVQDSGAPVADLPNLPDVLGECSVTIADAPTATDECEGVIVGTTADPLTYTEVGTYNITWTYADGSGNNASQTQQVVVEDSNPPVADIADLQAVVGECSVTVSDTPAATDQCGGVISGATADALIYSEVGTYVITWTYTDESGNSSSQTQQVIVLDSNAPVADVANLEDIVGECSVTVTAVPTATDGCDGAIAGITTDALTYTELGSYTIEWVFTDVAGNSTSQTQQVIVQDSHAPVADMANLEDVVGECSVTVASVPTATDACDGAVIGTTTDDLTYTELGNYTITWTYTDASGNSTSQTQQVVVQDSNPPVADAASLVDVVGECTATVTDIPTATDACDGTILGTTNDALSYDEVGTYSVTWTFTDAAGNSSTQEQLVMVKDTEPPVPLLPTLPDIVLECSNVGNGVIPPMANDACVGPVVATTVSDVEFVEEGTYSIKWMYEDGNGNSSSQMQTVILSDPVDPILEVVANIDVVLGTDGTVELDVDDLVISIVDNCGEVTVELDRIFFDCSDIGQQQLTVTATDVNGNSVSAIVDVEIIENPLALPVPTIVQLRDGELMAFDGEIGCFEQSNGLTLVADVDPIFDPSELTFSWTVPTGLPGTITGTNTQQLELDALAAFLAGATLSDISVSVSNGANGCSASGLVSLTSNVTEPVCPMLSYDGQDKISVVDPQPDREYLWSISTTQPGWAILSGNGTSSITIQVGTGSAEFNVEVTNTLNECTNENCTPLVVTTTSARTSSAMVMQSEPQLEYAATPNPMGASGVLTITSEESHEVTVELYSLANMKIADLYHGKIVANEVLSIPLDLTTVPNGIYVAWVRTENRSYSLKIIHRE